MTAGQASAPSGMCARGFAFMDLDFFVWPISHLRTESDGRPGVGEYEYLAPEDEVRLFLEKRCRLNKDARILGQDFGEHEEAFRVWRRWLEEGKLKSPFSVVHVDAHSDLGAGYNNTFVYLSDVLQLNASKRCRPEFSAAGVNSSNYLVFAIACRWLQSLTYVFPEKPRQVRTPKPTHTELFRDWLDDQEPRDCPPVRDLPPWCFQGEGSGWWKEPIQLSATEPPVQFELISGTQFEFGAFTHMTVAQSPYYTPDAADFLLRITREYFDPA